ncbi:hypothetical protein BGZ75_007373 [Mortierella antarctica]|nr:hypothetical protein BGZ67_008308 [Mortierella alpina]KAF9981351.1 hypothetical protein BGZ75_007373 [Mortierella antarctica]
MAMREVLRTLYRELYNEEAIDDLDPARIEKHVSQLHETLVQFGFECKGALRDMVMLYIKHVDAYGSENNPWLLFLIWIYILDDQIESFPPNVIFENDFDTIFNYGLEKEHIMYNHILSVIPPEVKNAFHTGVRYWYEGVKTHAYEHLRNSSNEISMYLARVQTGGTIPLIILGLAFLEGELGFVKDPEFIRIMNLQSEFIVLVNDIASFERESTEIDSCVANKENVPDIVRQLKAIDKAVGATNTKYIGHPMIECHKIFLWWHIVSKRYAPDTEKNVFAATETI